MSKIKDFDEYYKIDEGFLNKDYNKFAVQISKNILGNLKKDSNYFISVEGSGPTLPYHDLNTKSYRLCGDKIYKFSDETKIISEEIPGVFIDSYKYYVDDKRVENEIPRSLYNEISKECFRILKEREENESKEHISKLSDRAWETKPIDEGYDEFKTSILNLYDEIRDRGCDIYNVAKILSKFGFRIPSYVRNTFKIKDENERIEYCKKFDNEVNSFVSSLKHPNYALTRALKTCRKEITDKNKEYIKEINIDRMRNKNINESIFGIILSELAILQILKVLNSFLFRKNIDRKNMDSIIDFLEDAHKESDKVICNETDSMISIDIIGDIDGTLEIDKINNTLYVYRKDKGTFLKTSVNVEVLLKESEKEKLISVIRKYRSSDKIRNKSHSFGIPHEGEPKSTYSVSTGESKIIKGYDEFINEKYDLSEAESEFMEYLKWNDLDLPAGISMSLPHADADLYVDNFIEENPEFSENKQELIKFSRKYFTA